MTGHEESIADARVEAAARAILPLFDGVWAEYEYDELSLPEVRAELHAAVRAGLHAADVAQKDVVRSIRDALRGDPEFALNTIESILDDYDQGSEAMTDETEPSEAQVARAAIALSMAIKTLTGQHRTVSMEYARLHLRGILRSTYGAPTIRHSLDGGITWTVENGFR